MRLGVGDDGRNRVLRGGSWNNDGRNCRSAYRNWNHPGNRNHNIGFRLARAQNAAGWRLLTQPASRCPAELAWQQTVNGAWHVSRWPDRCPKACQVYPFGNTGIEA